MSDIEQRAHDLAVAFVTESYKSKGCKFEIDESRPFEFGSAYHHAYKAILNSLKEKQSEGLI